MLFNLLTIGVVILIIGVIIALLPTGQLPDNVTDALITTLGYIKAWGFFVDFNILFYAVGAIIFLEFWVFIFKVGMWLYRMIMRVNS